jgi:hypothetical protein
MQNVKQGPKKKDSETRSLKEKQRKLCTNNDGEKNHGR